MKVVGITSPMTGSGKTSVTLAILSRLSNATAFKIGPDYIDGGLSSTVTGNRTWNLDRWIQGRTYKSILSRAAESYDYGVVEGVMGLYDSGFKVNVSTSFYFQKLNIPFIVVVDISKLAESAFYIAKSFLNRNAIGVILNKYSSEKHLQMASKLFRENGIPVIGSIPADDEFLIQERHLGLKTGIELENLREKALKISGFIDFSFLDSLPDLKASERKENVTRKGKRNIWIAMDRAFNFYYADSIDALERIGTVNYFSPIKGEIPEDPDLIYFGGGYPELYAKELSGNNSLLSFIGNYSQSGGKIIAECGGLMYLEKEIYTDDGVFQLAKVFDGTVKMGTRPIIGYTELEALDNSILYKKGDRVRGHEFHYSTIEDNGHKTLKNLIGRGIDGYDGRIERNTLGSYTHISISRYSKRLEKSFG